MRRSLPIFILLTLLLGGCGGGSDDTTQPATAEQPVGQKDESRAYVAPADRICAGMIADSR